MNEHLHGKLADRYNTRLFGSMGACTPGCTWTDDTQMQLEACSSHLLIQAPPVCVCLDLSAHAYMHIDRHSDSAASSQIQQQIKRYRQRERGRDIKRDGCSALGTNTSKHTGICSWYQQKGHEAKHFVSALKNKTCSF